MTLDLDAPLVVGFGVTGQAVTKALIDHGHRPVVLDDRPDAATEESADRLGVSLVATPDHDALRRAIDDASLVLPSPGVPASHPLFSLSAASATPIGSEFDLAAAWDDRPLVGITGTNGKTTVTMLVTDALNRSGRKAAAVGNTEIPLVEALDDPTTEVFVVEASSFRLAHSQRFSPAVATWLNFAADHLDAHPSLEDYLEAKASIWGALEPEAVAIANAEDPTVIERLPSDAHTDTFGLAAGNWRRVGGQLIGPDGAFVDVDDLVRAQPHDLANATAAAATAFNAGADLESIGEALMAFEGLPHRVEPVGRWNGVSWFNDSKATVPHATLAAVGGFDSVVLIAGGKNKGLDLSGLADAVPPVHSVVAIGDAGPEVAEILAPLVPVTTAASMAEAIDQASTAARPGDAVLLSPGCTSFDWYRSYGERGNDFKDLVLQQIGGGDR